MNYKTSPTCQIPGLAQIYLDVFGYKTDGAFVEVGAYDGVSYSNTYGLAHIGWRGLYIEAVFEYYKKCLDTHREHARVEVIHECVGDGSPSNVYIGKEYTTTLHDFAVTAKQVWGAQYSGVQQMPTTTLNNILRDKWIGAMDLMVIDVEGSELNVLHGLSMFCWMPKMVIIEVHEKHQNPIFNGSADIINNYFSHYEYDKIYSDDCNNIYVRK